MMKTTAWALLARVVMTCLVMTCSVNATDNQSQAAPDNVIQVQVTAARNDKGQVLCALFAPDSGFPGKVDHAVAHTHSSIVNGDAVCEFHGIAPGRYAVSAFHDENANGKMDTNFVGIPKEGVAASNDAKGHMGPPKFDSAAFQYSGGQLQLKIKLVYL